MNMKFAGLQQDERSIVYVRPVPVADLPQEVQAEIGNLETVYSVNSPDGARLALVADRKMAFVLARQHEMVPLSVH